MTDRAASVQVTTVDLHRRADPLAARIFRQLSGLPLVDQKHVLAALNERYPFEPSSVSQERAFEAVWAFCEAQLASGQGARLGKKRYTQWRREQPVGREYSEVKTIVRAFGSWDQAILAASTGMELDLRSTRMLAAPAFTEEQIIESIKLYAADVDGPLALDGYLAWCRKETDSPSGRVGRVPLVGGPLQRLGGWRVLLERAGLGHRAASLRRASAGIETRQFTDEDLLATLREAQEAHGDRYLTGALYGVWRDEQIRSGRPAIASPQLFVGRFGSWNKAKHSAGLSHLPSHAGQSTLPYTTAEMIEALQRAARESDSQSLSAVRYEAWRRTQASEPNAARLPSAITVRVQLGSGSWVRARQVAGVASGALSPQRYSREQQAAALAGAIKATSNRRLGFLGYGDYRARLADPAELPHGTTIKVGIGSGSWRTARAIALRGMADV